MKKLFASFTLGRSINQFLCTLVILNMVFSSLRSGGVLATQMQPGNTLDILALSYVPNEIFIKVKPGIEVKATTSPLMAKASSSSSLNQILVVAGVESIMNPFYDRETLWQHIHKSPLPQPKDSVLSRWFKIKLRMQGNITETLKALEADPSVEAVDLNTFYYLNDGFPNDSKYSDQWGPKKIQLEPVWTYLTAGSPDVQVAVIDSGIDLNHPELADRYIYGRDYTSGTWTPTDERGHGTHVAGIIAALGNNGIGIAGAVWSSPVIIPLKVFTATGGTRNEWLAAATMDAADSQAKIINMSLGGEGMANRLGLLHDAIAYATDTKHKLVIAAAGNCAASNYSDNGCEHQNPEYYYPAAFPHVLAVAASTQNDGHADFSNHRIYVGVSAPGVRILSTLPTYDVALNQQWDCVGLLGLPKKCSHDYDSMDGTSMAAPFVSGVAALMLAVNPALRDADPDTLQNIIKQNADDVGTAGWDEFHGFGRLNAFKAVKAAMQVPPPPPTATPVSNGYDNAAFLSHITFPDGTVVSPGQSLIKTWRLRNTGTTTWDVGYQLVFISGEQMNAPSAVDVPNTAPGSTADISINLTAPTSQGEHTGYWRLRNPQGTYFGLKIRVKINVSDGTGGGGTGEISLTCLDCPAIVSPGYTFRPTIRATVHSGQLQGVNLRGDHLLNTDGNLFGAHPLIAITGNTIVNPNQSYNFTFSQDHPLRAPDTPGTYESKWRIWRGNNYAGQELTIRFEVRVGGGVNRAPNRPSLVSPTDWATFLSGGNISLQAQHNGDPDGDSINGYYFEVFTAGPIANSGWTSSNSWTPPSLGFENFQWRVKVRDQYNSESEWSEIRHFTVENNEPQIYSFYSMTCRPAWNQGEPEKICFCSDTNAGTQRLQVNTAPDGSENGEWIVLNEIGTPDYTCSSDNDRPPTWGHLSFDPGHYRVRLYARRDGGWAAAAHRDIFVDLTTDRRPDTPIGTPSNVYLNSQTVHFDWVDTKRTSSYRLIV
ncbi:partial Thermophilic serine proteinase, partial [Anaerolineae bacterium]